MPAMRPGDARDGAGLTGSRGSGEHCPPSPPESLDLPFFAYGALKPGDLAYPRIHDLVSSATKDGLAGALWLRDGLPLLDVSPDGAGTVDGFVLDFGKRSDEAYRRIGELEPPAHYRWHGATTAGGREVNVLVGKELQKGAVRSETNDWSSKDDPVFRHGLAVVDRVLRRHGSKPFAGGIGTDKAEEWERFFKLQAAYLLLWSAIERYCALSYGAGRPPSGALGEFAEDPRLPAALASHLPPRRREVVDGRDPRNRKRLDAHDPKGTISYYYQIRCNLSHRGKGAWRDGELVRLSLRELLAVVKQLLEDGASRA